MPMLSYGIREDQEMPKTEERVLNDQTSGSPVACPSAFGISTLESTENLRALPA
jgi:hypothetical protein